MINKINKISFSSHNDDYDDAEVLTMREAVVVSIVAGATLLGRHHPLTGLLLTLALVPAAIGGTHTAPVVTPQIGDECTFQRTELVGDQPDPFLVRVVSLERLLDGTPGAWVIPAAGPQRGTQIHVPSSQLSGCRR
jgi:hypothetical protein